MKQVLSRNPPCSQGCWRAPWALGGRLPLEHGVWIILTERLRLLGVLVGTHHHLGVGVQSLGNSWRWKAFLRKSYWILEMWCFWIFSDLVPLDKLCEIKIWGKCCEKVVVYGIFYAENEKAQKRTVKKNLSLAPGSCTVVYNKFISKISKKCIPAAQAHELYNINQIVVHHYPE